MKHLFRIDGDRANEQGDNARCEKCGMAVSSCLELSARGGHKLRAVKTVTGRYINGGWHAATPREWKASDRRCRP